jgi:hypothetical protein
MSEAFQEVGGNSKALFTLKVHRGDGMCLLAMNWKSGKPTRDFVGFAIEYQEPGGQRFFTLKNRLAFPGAAGDVNPNRLSTRLSPIQKFRWVHFPRNAELAGDFIYRVTPVFMNKSGELSYGDSQEASIELRRETYPGLLNVCYTRGFVSSQAFVDRFVTPAGASALKKLLPPNADEGLDFKPTHPQAKEALAWMGFEARSAILEVLDAALADASANVKVVAYDLCEPDIVSRLAKLRGRLQIIIDDSDKHGLPHSAESQAAEILKRSAGTANVKRQHMGNLQHNKTIVVTGTNVKAAVCGSTNFTWRGLFVQNNHAVVFRSPDAVSVFDQAFDDYFANSTVSGFGATGSAVWNDLKIPGVDAQAAFSPHISSNAVLKDIGKDVAATTSSLFFSLAFLFQTKGPIRDAISDIKKDDTIFSYGISDHPVKGLSLEKPDGKVVVISPKELGKNSPAPFKPEPTGGTGTRLHHKFLVLDFDKPTARVYFGSYNFSNPADNANGENLLLIRDRRIATSFVVEAVRIFDHYHFRVTQADAKKARKKLQLVPAPRTSAEKPWWEDDFRNARKIRDRELFA